MFFKEIKTNTKISIFLFFCFLFSCSKNSKKKEEKQIKVSLLQENNNFVLKIDNPNLLTKEIKKKDSIHYYQIYLYKKNFFQTEITKQIYRIDVKYDIWGNNYLVSKQKKLGNIIKGESKNLPLNVKINLKSHYFFKGEKYLVKLIYFITDEKTNLGYFIDKLFFLWKKNQRTFYSNILNE